MGFIGQGPHGTRQLFGAEGTYLHGGYFARNDVQVLAVCDVRRERRESALHKCNRGYAERLGQAGYAGVNAYNDFREVLSRDDIDAVLLALPFHWAAPMAIMAMRAGKDVYGEKPVAITVREGRVLRETARRCGRVFQAGTQQRSEYTSKFRFVCELVRNGRLGQLKEVYACREPGAFFPTPWTTATGQPVPDGFDWDLWLGPLWPRPYDGEPGNALPGMFIGNLSWSPHHYDFIQWVVNPDPAAPIVVEYEPPAAGRDAVIHYHYAHGVVVHSIPYPGETVGEEGGACFVGTAGRVAVDRLNLAAHPDTLLRKPIRASDQRLPRTGDHNGNFLDCVRTRRPPVCHPDTAVYSMNFILIGGIALALKRSLKWNPLKEEFENDAEANRLLSYAPRPPWIL
jgi:predicted dehydrogenase